MVRPSKKSSTTTAPTTATTTVNAELTDLITEINETVPTVINKYCKPLQLVDYVKQTYSDFKQLEVFVNKPDISSEYTYNLNIVFIKVILTDNSAKILHYEDFHSDIKCLVINKKKLEHYKHNNFCVIVYPEQLPYNDSFYCRALIANNNFEELINKYITAKQITFYQPPTATETTTDDLGI
jgi:hypothetical protein